ncbi:MAG: hypothetical protein HC880_02050 [Bacteroidia bacterium]|nr:hypothetical protein [Bacteroidia bacterium]
MNEQHYLYNTTQIKNLLQINYMKITRLNIAALMVFTMIATPLSSLAQTEDGALAKLAQNPVAKIYSFPFQNNTNWEFGPFERPLNVLNIQPVIPIPLGEKVNLINRVILPVITVPSLPKKAAQLE